ncbi:hypothetical protein BSKO_05212 [Bryopsis sp. KO-2023]|nr:hypothetical protein BSKO_05212 [Bryopsis sp. KO-2023]
MNLWLRNLHSPGAGFTFFPSHFRAVRISLAASKICSAISSAWSISTSSSFTVSAALSPRARAPASNTFEFASSASTLSRPTNISRPTSSPARPACASASDVQFCPISRATDIASARAILREALPSSSSPVSQFIVFVRVAATALDTASAALSSSVASAVAWATHSLSSEARLGRTQKSFNLLQMNSSENSPLPLGGSPSAGQHSCSRVWKLRSALTGTLSFIHLIRSKFVRGVCLQHLLEEGLTLKSGD